MNVILTWPAVALNSTFDSFLKYWDLVLVFGILAFRVLGISGFSLPGFRELGVSTLLLKTNWVQGDWTTNYIVDDTIKHFNVQLSGSASTEIHLFFFLYSKKVFIAEFTIVTLQWFLVCILYISRYIYNTLILVYYTYTWTLFIHIQFSQTESLLFFVWIFFSIFFYNPNVCF